MNTCPICSGPTLRHISHNRIYWYCTRCHEEVPNLLQCLLTKAIMATQQLQEKELTYSK
ncbi:MAG: hypothetical protein N5P05_001071 [Chroococcopsis gigantea SAG 12.99]|jgi:ribosomal protein L37AE/L43A|nr:hypothetical protein [Chlorogloea purpurea SAG 13.99]MDV2999465.1 hypothetical protein [Chroococcopsis gigantea SAG 12.99]